MRRWAFWVLAALVLAALNALILHKERVLRSGDLLYLRLAPVDPRSLMQGDYMALRYDIARKVPTGAGFPTDGYLVVTPDANLVATFVRIHDGSALAPAERLIRFRQRHDVRLGAESFFFQEGTADRYSGAKYGEVRVSPGGEVLIVGLRDEKFVLLGTN